MECLRIVFEDDRWPTLKALILRPGRTTDRISSASLGTAELFFLHGMLCAYASTTGTVGFIVADPRSTNLGALSLMGFYEGALYAKRSTRVVVGITGSFLNPPAEIKATQILINEGNADCIGSIQNDLTVHRVAARYGKFSTGVAADARFFVGESVLSSILLFWQEAIQPFYLQLANNSWSDQYSLHIAAGAGASLLSSFSTRAKDAWQDSLETARAQFLNHTLDLHCSTLINDTAWINPKTASETSPGVFCLNQTQFYRMTGIIQGAQVLAEFNSTHLPYEILYIHWHSFAAIFTTTLSLTVLTLALITVVVVIRNFSNPIIRASSPLLLLITLSGIALSSISSIPRIGLPTAISCMLPWWLYGFGHALTWSCLIAKNWRIWRIITSARLRPVAILNKELLLKWVVAIVAIELLVLLTWTFYSPLIPAALTSATLTNDQMQVLCVPKPNRLNGGILTWVGVNLALLLPGALVSYWTRNAKGEYDESRSLASAIYGTIVVTLVLGGVGFGMLRNYLVEFYMFCLGPLIITFSVWALLFVPKLIRLYSAAPENHSQTGEFHTGVLHSRNIVTPGIASNRMFSSLSESSSE